MNAPQHPAHAPSGARNETWPLRSPITILAGAIVLSTVLLCVTLAGISAAVLSFGRNVWPTAYRPHTIYFRSPDGRVWHERHYNVHRLTGEADLLPGHAGRPGAGDGTSQPE